MHSPSRQDNIGHLCVCMCACARVFAFTCAAEPGDCLKIEMMMFQVFFLVLNCYIFHSLSPAHAADVFMCTSLFLQLCNCHRPLLIIHLMPCRVQLWTRTSCLLVVSERAGHFEFRGLYDACTYTLTAVSQWCKFPDHSHEQKQENCSISNKSPGH